jgi:hypothetical protein
MHTGACVRRDRHTAPSPGETAGLGDRPWKRMSLGAVPRMTSRCDRTIATSRTVSYLERGDGFATTVLEFHRLAQNLPVHGSAQGVRELPLQVVERGMA